ncbi:MAG: thioesterase, partial [Lachnospiraceae bacterium]|nr:thioesterase [Lachnospiraceae bacterium]
DRFPRMFEKITVGTTPYEFTGCLGWRNVWMLDEQGTCIIRANSPWVYLNTDTGRPTRPEESETSAYGTEEKISMDYAPRKIRLPENMQRKEPVLVIQDFIDTNHHVNNAQYIEIALNTMEDDLKSSDGRNPRLFVREIRVEYKKQAVLGDVLHPKTGRQDDWDYVTLEDQEGHAYASVAFHFIEEMRN